MELSTTGTGPKRRDGGLTGRTSFGVRQISGYLLHFQVNQAMTQCLRNDYDKQADSICQSAAATAKNWGITFIIG